MQEVDGWLYGPRPLEWWTGPVPLLGRGCPGLLSDGTMTSLPLPKLDGQTLTREGKWVGGWVVCT